MCPKYFKHLWPLVNLSCFHLHESFKELLPPTGLSSTSVLRPHCMSAPNIRLFIQKFLCQFVQLLGPQVLSGKISHKMCLDMNHYVAVL